MFWAVLLRLNRQSDSDYSNKDQLVISDTTNRINQTFISYFWYQSNVDIYNLYYRPQGMG